MTLQSGTRRWGLRTVPPHLVRRYMDEGWWSDETLGTTVAAAVDRRAGTGFTIHSKVRPWRGTFAEVDAMARSFAASLRLRGVGPGDVVAFQLPNWVEAAVTFWGAARVGPAPDADRQGAEGQAPPAAPSRRHRALCGPVLILTSKSKFR